MKLLLSYLRPHWRLVGLALLLAAVNQCFSLLDPLIFRHVIDEYATKFDRSSTLSSARGLAPAPRGGRSHLRLPRREELPGLLRERRDPRLGAHSTPTASATPSSCRTSSSRTSGAARRSGSCRRSAPTSSASSRPRSTCLPDARRHRVRRGLRVQRPLARSRRSTRHGAAPGLAELGALAPDQARAEDDRGRDDGSGRLDDRVSPEHRAREEHGPRRAGDRPPQRHHRPDPRPRAAQGALPAQPQLRPGHGRERAADVHPLPDALPDLRARDQRRSVLRAVDLLVLHLRAPAGAGHGHQRVPRDRGLARELPEDPRHPAGAAAEGRRRARGARLARVRGRRVHRTAPRRGPRSRTSASR